MAALHYPSTIRLPLIEGYGFTPVSPLIRTELTSGRARQRRRFTSTPTVVSVSWIFDPGEARVFELWFRTTLNDGAEWFDLSLKTPEGLLTYDARFTDIYSGPEWIGKSHWKFSAELELLVRPVYAAEWAIVPLFVQYADVIDYAVNRELP